MRPPEAWFKPEAVAEDHPRGEHIAGPKGGLAATPPQHHGERGKTNSAVQKADDEPAIHLMALAPPRGTPRHPNNRNRAHCQDESRDQTIPVKSGHCASLQRRA